MPAATPANIDVVAPEGLQRILYVGVPPEIIAVIVPLIAPPQLGADAKADTLKVVTGLKTTDVLRIQPSASTICKK